MTAVHPEHTPVPVGDVEVVLDLRASRLNPTGAEQFAELWEQLEPGLLGHPLRTGFPYSWSSQFGDIAVEVVRLRPGVTVADQGTRFDVVAVRQRANVTYRCGTCAESGTRTYGPFLCRDCAGSGRGDRVCDEHVVILDGSLATNCPVHRPGCRACGQPATFRCAGDRCHAKTAWCDAHRVRHPEDPDTDYCRPCYQLAFPVCEQSGCRGVGTMACDIVDGSGRSCGRQACTRHALRWQVFGGEKTGLGLCRQHYAALRGWEPAELMRQIAATAARRGGEYRIPRLVSFSHNLRNTGHPRLAVDYSAVYDLLRRLCEDSSAAGDRRSADALRRADAGWRRELDALVGTAKEGERLLSRLQALVEQQDGRRGPEVAAALRLVEYKAPRVRNGVTERRGILFVDLPSQLRGLFIGAKGANVARYRDELGVDVKFEGDRSRR
ncbi:hypothetical protein [Streptomyces olivochromogenes]|uniref:hypothetical protein n=1 Tax=Streptomyces olivochromogenes TaxID=1963 RepID=UPI001F1A1361|nr:hypothetical protein [Streptomyces olivochromogenes]MCF3132930.1 hypothetical protein [Streptomyces olivochromogenes]